ncbi:hypothetical protein HGM15179_021925, partial [Zosterops borbonicus]
VCQVSDKKEPKLLGAPAERNKQNIQTLGEFLRSAAPEIPGCVKYDISVSVSRFIVTKGIRFASKVMFAIEASNGKQQIHLCVLQQVQMDEVRWIKSRSLCIGGVYSSEREVKRDVASQSEEGKVVHLCDVLVLDASAQEVTWDIGTPGEADRVVHLQGVPVLDPGSLELLRPYAYQRREASRYPPGSLRSQMVI